MQSSSAVSSGAPSLPATTRRVLPVFLGLTALGSWPMWLALAALRPPQLAVDLAVAVGSFAPAFAGWMVSRLVAPTQQLSAETGLTVRVAGVRWPLWWAVAWLGMPLLVLAALALSTAAGSFPLDVSALSGARAGLAQYAATKPQEAAGLTPGDFLLWQVGRAALFGPFLFAPVAFGQEWGWRGWLLPRLLPLGRVRALALTGALWGLWLAPLALAGHAYPGHPVLGMALLVLTCTLLGTLLGWLRLAGRSVWPAVVASASLCAAVGTGLRGTGGVMPLLAREGAPLDAALAGPTGWPGWLLMAACVAALALTGQLATRGPDAAGRA